MEIQIEKLPGEPIILVAISGNLDLSPPPDTEATMRQALADSPERDTLIVDIRGVPASFENLIHLLKLIQSQEGLAESLHELAAPPVFVGSNSLVDTVIRKALPKYFGTEY